MIRPLFSLERLSFSEKEGKVGYWYGKEAKEMERMDYLEFRLSVFHDFLFVRDERSAGFPILFAWSMTGWSTSTGFRSI